MPIYEYEVTDGDCRVCGGRFELRRPRNRPPLLRCPLCRKAVRKVISSANTPKVAQPLSATDAKKAGFSVFEKRDRCLREAVDFEACDGGVDVSVHDSLHIGSVSAGEHPSYRKSMGSREGKDFPVALEKILVIQIEGRVGIVAERVGPRLKE